MKDWLKNKHHFGATLPLGAIVVAIILSAGLIFQVKVLQQQTHTTSKASANSCIQTGCPSGYVCQSVCPTGISCNSTATVCVDVNGATPTPSDSGSPTPTSSPNSTPTPLITQNTKVVVALVTHPKISKKDKTIVFAWSFASGADGYERVNPYEVGAPITQPLTSVFLNCTGQPLTSPIPTGSCTIANVLGGQDVSKKYELRMFAKDGNTVIATSNPIELTD